MDPVSVAASVLTVLGAAATAARTLDHLSSLKHAPDTLVALVNEVSDLRVVLHNVRDAVQDRAESSQECGNLSFIVQRASSKLSELNRLIFGNLLKTDGLGDDDTIKASQTAFLRHSGKLKALKEDIQEIKMSMMIAMGTLTFSDVSRLRLDVCDVSVLMPQRGAMGPAKGNGRSLPAIGNSDEPKPPSTVLDASSPSFQASRRLPEPISHESASLDGHDWKMQSLSRSSTQIESLPQYLDPLIGSPFQSLPADHKQSHLRVEASVSSVSYQKDRLCLCQCHQATTVTSPGEWSNVIGRLFVGYTGLPLPTKKCDRKSCQHGQVQTRIRVAYLFPFWFAWKMFALTVTKASTSFMWKLDFPAVTQGSSSEMFVHASLGNVEKIQSMLSVDAGSFNIIDSVANKSTLHVRT
ncbi:MAG: hypothetical protein Q9174_005196 [Haloplaca sp. 1 TL-2023]